MFKETYLVDPQRPAGTPKNLVLKVLEQRFRHNVTYREVSTCNQSIKCNKHVLYECIERNRK
jgi:hypothetical protein